MSKKEFWITVVVVVLAIGLIAGVIVANNLSNANKDETTPSTGVAHDHNGDGIPDHGDEAHENEGTTDSTGDSTNNDGTSGDGGNSSGGNSSGGVVPEDTDVDISIELEDIPTDGGNSGSTGNQGGSTGNQGGSTGNEGGSTGNEGGSTGNQGGSSGNEGSNEQGGNGNEGSSSGAVSGNEIDFDDLLNRGQN